jgi:peptidoglycan/LPS O-acetylase OafA/YrhL
LLHFRGRALCETLGPAAVTFCALASIVIFSGCSFYKPTGTWALLVQCVTAATLIALVAYRSEAAIFTLLDRPIVRFYGKISYSFYLLHPLTLWSAGRLTEYLVGQFDALPTTLVLLTVFVLSVAAITPLAYASWRFIEWPATRKRSSLVPAHSMTGRESLERA